MGNFNKIRKVCSFYVSGMHLVTMILPHVKKQLDVNVEIITFFECNLEKNAQELLSKVVLAKEDREAVLQLDWNLKRSYKFFNVEKEIKNKIMNNSELNILIAGSNKYIEATNENLSNFFNKNAKKLKEKDITIINCYEVTQFNDDIEEILDTHEAIMNTSGILNISEVFEGYEKKVAN